MVVQSLENLGTKFVSGKSWDSHRILLKEPKIIVHIYLLLDAMLFQIENPIRTSPKLLCKNVNEFLKNFMEKLEKIGNNIPVKFAQPCLG